MMRFDRFTERAQEAAQRAAEIIQRYGHNQIDTEHILLALIEGIGSTLIGPAHATTLSFVLLIIFLIVRPQGLLGRKGFE